MDRNRIAIFFELIKNIIGLYLIYWKNEYFFMDLLYVNIELYLGFYFIMSMILTTWIGMVYPKSQKISPLLR